MWSSNWVRTLFFNLTQFDEQNSKFSPRVRTFELAQSSSSNRIACSAQFVEQTWSFNFKIDHSTRDFCMSRDSNWVLDEQVCLFDSIRRTRTRIRSILSNKNSNPFNSFEQKECVQFCSILELNVRARVQLNSTVILMFETFLKNEDCFFIYFDENLLTKLIHNVSSSFVLSFDLDFLVIFAFVSFTFVSIVFASFFNATRFRKRVHESFSSTLKKRSRLTNDHCDCTLSSKWFNNLKNALCVENVKRIKHFLSELYYLDR
jgi:hypothetical protein